MADNPNVAKGSSSTPQMLSSVGRGDAISVYQHLCCPGQSAKSVSAPYQMSNSMPVGRSPVQCSSSGSILQGQAAMPKPQPGPAFEKLAPKSLSTTKSVPGLNYKP